MQFVRSPQAVTERSQCEQQRFFTKPRARAIKLLFFVFSIAKPSQQRLQVNVKNKI